MRVVLTIILLVFLGFDVFANHFIGADMTYTCVGNNQYLITTTIYRDCGANGPNLADEYDFDVYDLVTGANVAIDMVMAHDGVIPIVFNNDDPCVEYPASLCLEKAVYTGVVQLPPSLNGYYINFNSCCFAMSVSNIVSANTTSLSVSTIIPPAGSFNTPCVSSPVFDENPPLALCLYDDIEIDLGVSWPAYTNATMVYDFYSPDINQFNGPPVYPAVGWLPNYSNDYAIPSDSTLDIDPFTGLVTGLATQLGHYLMGVHIFAVENGDTIAELNRVFRYSVVDCNINRSIAGIEIEPVCGDLSVSFINESFGAEDFEWNFDDVNSPDNIVTVEEPTHVFSDYGVYNVQLVTSAGNLDCTDTSYVLVVLEDGAESEISVNNNYQCLSANNFNFQATSSKSGVSYLWDFGPGANIQSSDEQNPNGIIYNQVGIYTVSLSTFYEECEFVTSIQVEVFDGVLSEFTGPTEGCAPFNAAFNATVINADFIYTWTINDTEFSGAEINMMFNEAGVHDVSLHVEDPNGCESTFTELEFLTVDDVPETGFNISDEYISVGDNISITNLVQNMKYDVAFNIPGIDLNINSASNFAFSFENEGQYEVIQTVTNGACSSELVKIIHVGPPRIVAPNVFTPNGDQINDLFYINPHYNTNIEIYIFDRWGVEVFSSSNYELCDPNSGQFCWDGTDKNGDKCIEGAYAYLIVLPNGFEASGFVQLFQ